MESRIQKKFGEIVAIPHISRFSWQYLPLHKVCKGTLVLMVLVGGSMAILGATRFRNFLNAHPCTRAPGQS